MNPLVGKTIVEIFLADDQGAIKFVLSDGSEIVAHADCDCCSHTWIEEIINLPAALRSPVLKAEDIELPAEFQQPTKRGHYEEEMSYYGFAIKTLNGCCTIAYRNSSNGYYGGSLSWPDEHYYGGVFGQNKSSENWQPVKE